MPCDKGQAGESEEFFRGLKDGIRYLWLEENKKSDSVEFQALFLIYGEARIRKMIREIREEMKTK